MAVLQIIYQTAHGITPAPESVMTNSDGSYNLLAHGNWSGTGFPVLTEEDWIFQGWMDESKTLIINAEGELIDSDNGYSITSNVTLTAKWQDDHLYAHLDSIVDVQSKVQESPSEITDVQLSPGDGTAGQTNVEQAYATYGHIDANASAIIYPDSYYTVTFEIDSDHSVVVHVLEGGYVTPPEVSLAGHTLLGWSADPPFWTLFDFDQPITEDTYLWPSWHENAKATVTFDYNLPEGAIGPIQTIYPDVLTGTWMTIDEDVSGVIGYSLIGWFSDELSGYEATNPFYVDGDITWYGHWRQDTTRASTVTFYLNYNETVWHTTIIPLGGKVSLPTNPTRTNYTFGGWYTSASCRTGTEFNPTLPIYTNTNLYAKWTSTATPVTFPIYAHSFTQAEVDTMIANHNFRAFGVPIQATQGTPCNIFLPIPSISAQQQYRFILTPARFGAIDLEDMGNGPLLTYVTTQWPGGFYTLYRHGAPISVGGPDGGVYFIHRSEQPIPGVWQVQVTLPLS